jgi:hypothetical protein
VRTASALRQEVDGSDTGLQPAETVEHALQVVLHGFGQLDLGQGATSFAAGSLHRAHFDASTAGDPVTIAARM